MASLNPLALRSRFNSSSRANSTLGASSPLDCSARDHQHPMPSAATPRPRPRPAHRLCILPGSAAEWKTTLRDIKRLYADDRYRPCSDRCHDILNNAKDLDELQPSYLVYLRFYAAAALEMQARALPLHHSSSRLRLSLLQQARDHYRAASLLAQQADDTVSLPSSRVSSPSWSTPSSRMPSPVPSLCSSASSAADDGPKSPELAVLKPKKKRVSFCDVPVMDDLHEPLVRPDSPTLGLDDWSAPSSPRPLTSFCPEPILKRTKTPELMRRLEEQEDEQQQQQQPQEEQDQESVGPLSRYCTILSNLRDQSTCRLAALETEIATCHAAPTPAATETLSDELRILDISSRIERLRANGWRRPRFDARRYEALRETVLADLLE